jgi:hypothetical protein
MSNKKINLNQPAREQKGLTTPVSPRPASIGSTPRGTLNEGVTIPVVPVKVTNTEKSINQLGGTK